MVYRDPIIEHALRNSLPLDRETYIAACYPDGMPDPWTAEHEAELPKIFRTPNSSRAWRRTPAGLILRRAFFFVRTPR